MSNLTKKDRVLALIAQALPAIRAEIEKAQQGEEAVDGLQQLRFIDSKLCELADELQRETWREIPKSKPGMAHLVVDTWPLKHALGDLIVQIEYEYERLK